MGWPPNEWFAVQYAGLIEYLNGEKRAKVNEKGTQARNRFEISILTLLNFKQFSGGGYPID